jgi:CheY-like chemotaxis protein
MKIDRDKSPIIQIDDDPSSLYLIERHYKKTGLKNELVSFESGLSFFDYLDEVRSLSRLWPFVVLLDINMPEMDGFEVLHRLKKDPEFKEIPLCTMLTSSQHEKDKSKASELGSDEFFKKPSTKEEFEKLFEWVNSVRLRY